MGLGSMFDVCSCYELYHEDAISVEENWHADAVHGLETRVLLVWNSASDYFPCIDNYPNGIHGAYYSQLVILLREQHWKQRFADDFGGVSNDSGIIDHQSTAISYNAYNFDQATDDVLKNIIAVVDYDEVRGFWHGDSSSSLGGEIFANGWTFEFHPDFGLRYYMGSLGNPSGDISKVYISPEQQKIVLGRFQLDANCNVIGEQAGVSLPQFMRNRPKEYLLVLPSSITFSGDYEGTEYSDHVLMAAGQYPFQHRCTTRNYDCTSSPGGFQFVFSDCLCEPYNFSHGQFYGTQYHYFTTSDCNDPDALQVSWGKLAWDSFGILSLLFATHQGWSAGAASADWKIKTGTNIDFYRDTIIEPKSSHGSITLSLPAEAIIRFNGFGL